MLGLAKEIGFISGDGVVEVNALGIEQIGGEELFAVIVNGTEAEIAYAAGQAVLDKRSFRFPDFDAEFAGDELCELFKITARDLTGSCYLGGGFGGWHGLTQGKVPLQKRFPFGGRVR